MHSSGAYNSSCIDTHKVRINLLVKLRGQHAGSKNIKHLSNTQQTSLTVSNW